MKISSTAPYLQARYTAGLHVADADGDDERVVQADTLWQQLPKDQTISARNLARKLYEEAPRCLSYLDTSMRPSVPSLLSQEMTKMRSVDSAPSGLGTHGRMADGDGPKSHLEPRTRWSAGGDSGGASGR